MFAYQLYLNTFQVYYEYPIDSFPNIILLNIRLSHKRNR
jgi:hypothetical protein